MRGDLQLLRLAVVILTIAIEWVTGFAWAGEGLSLKEGDGKQWYRGVTHFHTLWSDGDAPPEVAVTYYEKAGYDFIAISDHNILLVGEKWFPVEKGPQARLTQEKVDSLQLQFGPHWVVLRHYDDHQDMRLKTLSELIERFQKPGRFLIIPGEELTTNSYLHVNAINIREIIPPVNTGTEVEILKGNLDRIEAHARKHGIPVLAHLNHPNYGVPVTAEELASVRGERIFEVYNGHPVARNWGDPKEHVVSTDRLWDIVLTLRLAQDADTDRPLYAIASDDAHDWYYERNGPRVSAPGRGWVMVLSESLTTEALITAIKRGDFYASSGVTLDEIQVDDSEYRVAIEAEEGVTYTTHFIGTMKGTDLSSVPVLDEQGNPIRASRIYDEGVGRVLSKTTDNPAIYRMTDDELYVRAKIISSKAKPNSFQEGDVETAWTQPVSFR